MAKQAFRSPGTKGLELGWKLKTRFAKRGEYIFIPCLPKSGSTFLAIALAHLTGYQKVSLCYAYGRNDQDLYLPTLIDAFGYGSVTHQHTRATEANVELLRQFHIRPVVLVRNIFDCVASIHDHLFNEGFDFPTFYCDARFSELDRESQYDLIIDLALPWYFNFYVSWQEAIDSGKIEALWLTYEQLLADKVKTLSTVAAFYGISKTSAQAQRTLEAVQGGQKTRYNKGVSGRGAQVLSDAQKRRIIATARYYPWVDFSSLGIAKQDAPGDARQASAEGV